MKYSVNGIIFEVPEGVTHFEFMPTDNECSISHNIDLLVIKYKSGCTAGYFKSQIPEVDVVYEDYIIIPYLKPIKIEYMEIRVNRDKELLKICYEDINIIQLRYKVDVSELVNNYFNFTLILAAFNESESIEDYYQLLLGTKVFELINPIESKSELMNVMVHNSKVHNISSDRVYLPQSKYRKYRISNLDYVVDFFLKLSELFEEYGLELVEWNKVKDAKTSNIVTYKVETHASDFIKRVRPAEDHDIMFSGARISFVMMTSDTDIYEDFKIRYNNIDLIQNHREFKCKDKYNFDWRYDVVWQGTVDESFIHDIQTNDFGSYGYQFPFRATLEFWDVYDEVYNYILSILMTYKISDVYNYTEGDYERKRIFYDQFMKQYE
jgi:hypothetical protein